MLSSNSSAVVAPFSKGVTADDLLEGVNIQSLLRDSARQGSVPTPRDLQEYLDLRDLESLEGSRVHGGEVEISQRQALQGLIRARLSARDPVNYVYGGVLTGFHSDTGIVYLTSYENRRVGDLTSLFDPELVKSALRGKAQQRSQSAALPAAQPSTGSTPALGASAVSSSVPLAVVPSPSFSGDAFVNEIEKSKGFYSKPNKQADGSYFFQVFPLPGAGQDLDAPQGYHKDKPTNEQGFATVVVGKDPNGGRDTVKVTNKGLNDDQLTNVYKRVLSDMVTSAAGDNVSLNLQQIPNAEACAKALAAAIKAAGAQKNLVDIEIPQDQLFVTEKQGKFLTALAQAIVAEGGHSLPQFKNVGVQQSFEAELRKAQAANAQQTAQSAALVASTASASSSVAAPPEQVGGVPPAGGLPEQGGVPPAGGLPEQGGVPPAGGLPEQVGVPPAGGLPEQVGVPPAGGLPEPVDPPSPAVAGSTPFARNLAGGARVESPASDAASVDSSALGND